MGLLVLAGPARPVGDPSQPGAYCPFPKQGEKPVCFSEVEQEYSGFFAAVDSGQVDDPEVAELERTLKQAAQTEARTLALSSLAYGYFMLAERAASADRPDPALVARLETWNELLSAVYEDADSEPSFRTAVREAALDLHSRAPAVRSSDGGCAKADPGSNPDGGNADGGNADGQPCRTTSRLLAALRQIDDPTSDSSGVRGALGRLLGRMLDDDDVVVPTSDSSGGARR